MSRFTRFLTVVLVLGFMLTPALIPVGATSVDDVNLFNIYGTTTSGDWTIYDAAFETDSDVDTYLQNNVLHLWDSHYTIHDLTVDWVDSSIGKNTLDWTGTVGDSDDPASGGVYYWMANASTPSESAATGDGFTWSSLQKKTPENGGYSFSISSVNAESSENSDVDSECRYWSIEDDLVDATVTSQSCLYINVITTFSGVNATKDLQAKIYAMFSDGVNELGMVIIFDGSVTDSTAWADGATTTVVGSGVTEEDNVYWNEKVNTAATAENFVMYYNIQDALQNSAAYPTFSPSSLVEIGVMMSSAYGSETATVEINQLMVVDDEQDISLFAETDSADSSTRRTNNYPNATSVDIDTWDTYSLVSGMEFACSSNVPINSLTFSKYMIDVEPNKREYTVVASSYVVRQDTFDTSPPSAERLTNPTTMYANISSYKTSPYYFTQLWIAAEEVFDSNGDFNSGYAIYDSDSSPTFVDLADLLTEMDDWDDALRLSHTDLNTAQNSLTLAAQYGKPSTEIVSLGEIDDSGSGGAAATASNTTNLLGVAVVVLGAGYGIGAIHYKGKAKYRTHKLWRWYK